jgi:hypothetical protein
MCADHNVEASLLDQPRQERQTVSLALPEKYGKKLILPGGIMVQVGTRPVTVFTEWDFTVTGVDPAPPAPEPSNTRKRQLARAQQPQFSCLPGQSYCWTGRGKNFACVNTSSDVACE